MPKINHQHLPLHHYSNCRSLSKIWGAATGVGSEIFSPEVPAGAREKGSGRAPEGSGQAASASLPRRGQRRASARQTSQRRSHCDRHEKTREILFVEGRSAMATLSGNGGAERFWKSTRDRSRLALCRNGKLLKQREPSGRRRFTVLRLEDVARDPAWRSEMTSTASAASPARHEKRGAVAPMT